MKNKINIMYLSIIIIMLITLAIGTTYAFFGSGKTVASKLNTTVVTGNISAGEGYKFASTSGQSLISVNNTEVTGSTGNKKNVSVNITAKLLSNSFTKYLCTYDIYYKWDDNTDEYTITGANEFTYSLDGGAETNFVASSNKTPQKINSESLIIKNKSKDTPTEISHTINTKFYKISGDQTANAGKFFSINFYIDNVECEEVQINSLVALLEDQVESSNSVSSGSGYLQKQTVSVTQNATLGINSSSYENIIFTGSNPNNYIEFNGELWRILGVYNEDSHGIANTKLVKIIRKSSLGSYSWDYKGSNGSTEWSDSQLMFMLNGEDAINKGKMYDGTTYTYANTRVNGNYIQTRVTTGTYYNIWNKSNGSYLSYDSNGDAYTSKTIYKPSSATSSSYSEATATISKTLSRDAQNYIQEAVWHLGGIYNYPTTSEIYKTERGTQTYGGNGPSSSSTLRSITWTGKIGLMYVSDYAYATSGGSTCTSKSPVYYWKDYSACYNNDWVVSVGFTAWTITPAAYYGNEIMYFNSTRFDDENPSSYNYQKGVYPTLYLKADTMVTDEGDGSSNHPYILKK